jgi:hypothetical protein
MFAPFKCSRPRIFRPSFLGKIKNLTRLISVISLPFKFVHNHKSCPNSAASLLGLSRGRPPFQPQSLKINSFGHGEGVGGGGGGRVQLQQASLILPGAGALGRAGGKEGRSVLVLDTACLHPLSLCVSLSLISILLRGSLSI